MKSIKWSRLGNSSPQMPVFVSYFTEGFYFREAFELARTLQFFPLDFSIKSVGTKGSWEGNTNQKPGFLLEMSKEFPKRSICWLDADARMRQYPVLLHGLQNPIAYHTWKGPMGTRGALSGTVYLAMGPQRDQILEAWKAEVEARPDATDQVCMEAVIRRMGVDRGELPVEYTWIYDLAQNTDEPDPENAYPVIEHLQASRWTRRG